MEENRDAFDDKLDLIKLAFRERIINYFKMTNHRPRVKAHSGIEVSNVNRQGSRHRYERLEYQYEEPKVYSLASIRMFRVSRGDRPTLTVEPAAQGHPILSDIADSVVRVVEKYLPGVTVKRKKPEDLPGMDVKAHIDQHVALEINSNEPESEGYTISWDAPNAYFSDVDMSRLVTLQHRSRGGF